MNDTTSAASSAECRAEFEAWAKSHDLAYKSSDPAAMWTWAAWQAAWNRRAPQPVAREPLTFGGRWLCLVCKSSTRGVHGTLDDMVTPCPEGTASSIGAHGIGSACAIAKAKQGGA